MTTTTSVQLEIAPLSGTIGAEIRDIDLHQTLEPDTLAAVRQALLDYKVIFFPGQHLSPEEHKAFASRFGEITVAHPVIPGLEDHKEVFEIDYTKGRRALVGGTGSRLRRPGELAHRCHLRGDATAGFRPQRHRDTGGRRRHLVGRHAGRLRRAVPRDPPVRRRTDRGARRRSNLRQGARRRGQG